MTFKEVENQVKETVKKRNEEIEYFYNVTLPEKLGKSGKDLKMEDWLKAQAIIKEEKLYEKSYEILRDLRNKGFDVKMDMQSNKLVY